MKMPYASRTRVPADRTKHDIETMLTRNGANRFAFYTEPGKAAIVFEMEDRRLRFTIPLPEGSTNRVHQQQRQRWRALLLCIKAKLESVDSKIETFEEAFLAHVVMPDGKTVYEHSAPRLAQVYKGKEMQALLPGPS